MWVATPGNGYIIYLMIATTVVTIAYTCEVNWCPLLEKPGIHFPLRYHLYWMSEVLFISQFK